jgi:glycosyltransferase involved in cell wall biosynthesis
MSSPSQRSHNRISIALCTYNGERFLAGQLASIAQQTRPADELIVCDDRSTDRTVSMIREFASSVSYPVKIFENERNLGFVANFQQAIQLCDGDMIALCDQDDIWYPCRLERTEQEFDAHPEVGLVFSDGDIIDDQDRLQGTKLWPSFGFVGERKERMFAADYTVLAKNRFVTGATVAFRSRLREHCLPVGSGWLHDEWIVATAAGVAEVRPIDVPLIRYRQHTAQQVGLSPSPSFRERNQRHWSELSRQIGLLEEVCRRLSQQPLSQQGEALYACYQAHLGFARFRYALPEQRLARLGAMLGQYASYTTCGSGVFSMATDLLLSK